MMARWIRLGALNAIEFETLTTRLAAAQASHSAPVLAWGEDDMQYCFALIVPRRIAPGKSTRWSAWGLAPPVAAYRQFDVPAYFEQEGIWLHGRCIGDARVQSVGDCVLVGSVLLAHFPGKCAVTPSVVIEDALRGRLEAQHGWQFDNSWPTAPEKVELAALAP
jgi:hypothetical protein